MISQYLIQCILIVPISWLMYHLYLLVQIIRNLLRIGGAVNQFPMDKKHWFNGHANKLTGTGEETISYFVELMKKYPRACGLYLTILRPYVLVHHPETVKVALKKMGQKPLFTGMYGYARLWLGDGLILSSGVKWRRNRKLLTPTFHFDALRHYVIVKNEASDEFLNSLSKLAETKSTFEIYSLVSLLTFDIILRCAFSYQSGVQYERDENVYINAVNGIGHFMMKRQYNPLHHFDFIYWKTKDGKSFIRHCDTVNNLASKLIKERRKLNRDYSEKSQSYHDFLDILMRSKDEDGSGLTDDEIKDEIKSFIFAGYETTASAISWTLYSLAQNPGYQKNCQQEIDDLFKGRAEDHLTWNDLQNLPYLTMCFKEALRLYCPPLIERQLDEDAVIDGKLVPAGTTLMINLYAHHRNPAVWEDPLTYDPERFLPERSESIDPFAYVPFSAGSRNCIGQAFALNELKVVLARTLNRFSITVKENHTPMPKQSLILKSENGIYLSVSER